MGTVGRVFSIEEFATFDGPGIRTTVFLKGCPLRCTWCHNPEGQSFESRIVRNPNGCTGCGACLGAGFRACGRRELTPESIAACPNDLIRRCGEDYTPEELFGKLRKNLRLLNAGGGGVTFSGGEPLSQIGFFEATAGLLHGKTSVALQTSGFAEAAVFDRALALCDYVLYDLKLISREEHIRFTSRPNDLIKENFRTLCKSGVPFVVRVPLIPSVTDTAENIRGIAELMRANGAKNVELLPYNRMAGAKYAMAGMQFRPGFREDLKPETRCNIFEKYGITAKIM